MDFMVSLITDLLQCAKGGLQTELGYYPKIYGSAQLFTTNSAIYFVQIMNGLIFIECG